MSNHFSAVEGYSDEALSGAIASLCKNPRTYDDNSWESSRLEALKSERNRRNSKRRGKVAA